MGDTEGEATGANIPEVELIIKASTIDGRRKGACLFCQVCFHPSFVKTKSMISRNTSWTCIYWQS